MHIRETEVTPGIAVGELLMVYSEKVQDGGMEVVHVHGIFLHEHAEPVRRSVGQPPFDPAPGEQVGKGRAVMVPSGLGPLLSLGEGCAPKLTILTVRVSKWYFL